MTTNQIESKKDYLKTFRSLGIMTWEEGLKENQKFQVANFDDSMMRKANEIKNSASSLNEVKEMVLAYEKILEFQAENSEILIELGSHCALIGYGYAETLIEKEIYLLKSIQYSEKLMYLNPDFQSAIKRGNKLWDACVHLSKEEMAPMWWWYMAGAAYWKECRGTLGRVFNIRWAFRAKKVLQILFDLDPEWQYGTPYYAMAVYYSQAPGFAGGNLEMAKTFFDRAIQLGPTMLNFRRSRALFLHTKTKDKVSFMADLLWVLEQSPKVQGLSYAWNVFLQKDAKKALANIDRYFPF